MTTPSVLLVQERGRHKENQQYRECENFKRSFARIGVRAETWGLGYENFDKTKNDGGFQEVVKPFDVVFVLENYDEARWLPELADLSTKLKVFWSIDSHCSLNKHLWMSKRMKFDIHLNSTSGYVNQFASLVQKGSFWFPNAYPNDLVKPLGDPGLSVKTRPHKVGYCGSIFGDRQWWLGNVNQMLARTGGPGVKQDVLVLGDAMVAAVNSYCFGLNRTLADDTNYRVFETTGCGTVLVTNNTPDLSRLFKPDEEVLVYSTPEMLVDKIAHCWRTVGRTEGISAAGLKRATSDHTFDIRAKQFVELVTTGQSAW